MKIKRILLTLSALSGLALSAFELGKSNDVIYYQKTDKELAEELGDTLQTAFGQHYETAPIETAQGAGIYLGWLPEGFVIDKDQAKEYYVIHAAGDKLHLAGNAKFKNCTAHAAYFFLQKYCGVRYLWPGELGTVIPQQPALVLKDFTDVYQPPFRIRLTHSFHYPTRYMHPADVAELNQWQLHRGIGSSLKSKGSGFGHAFASLMPVEKYGKEHPEYYSLVSPENWFGSRRPDKPRRTTEPGDIWQLCTSNPDVRRIIAEKLAAQNTDEVQSVSPNDGYGFCECENCKAQDLPSDSPLTERIYNFLADVATQAKKLNPQTNVGMFGYSFFSGVPKNIKLPDNVYISLCYIALNHTDAEKTKKLDDQIIGLGNIGAKVVGREYWGTHYFQQLPILHSTRFAHNLKVLHQAHAAGIYGEPDNSFAVRASDNYILTGLAWDPTRNRDELLHEFCAAAFGKAGQAMYDYFDGEEKAFLVKYDAAMQKEYPVLAAQPSLYSRTVAILMDIFDEAWTKQAVNKLNAAAKLVSGKDKERIEFIKTGIQYAKVRTEELRGYRDLAAAGFYMPLLAPSDNKPEMSKDNLRKLAKIAAQGGYQLDMFMGKYSFGNAFCGLGFLRERAMNNRPWKSLAELAVTTISQNQFNYLFNGAFEYRLYGWEVLAENAASAEPSLAKNLDRDINIMANCHGNQGISAMAKLPPKSSLTLKSKYPIVAKNAAKLMLGGAMFGGDAAVIEARLNDVSVELFSNAAYREADEWLLLKARTFQAAPGTYTPSLKLSNPSQKELTLYLDNWQIIMEE